MLRIKGVEPIAEFRVLLNLTDGERVERDLDSLLSGKIFEPIRSDPAAFRQVRVIDGTLSWPNGIDLDPDMIIWGGPPPVDAQERIG